MVFAAQEQAHGLLLHVLPSPFVTGTEKTLPGHGEQRLQAMTRAALVPVQILVKWWASIHSIYFLPGMVYSCLPASQGRLE